MLSFAQKYSATKAIILSQKLRKSFANGNSDWTDGGFKGTVVNQTLLS